MFLGSQQQFHTSDTVLRIERLLEGVDAGNGTPAAAAVISALEVDQRIGGAKGNPAPDQTDRELIELSFAILSAISSPRSSVVLPRGTVFETTRLGDITIGGERWVLDAGKPGLHPMEMTSKAAHGPNLQLLHRHIERMTRKLACRRLGLPHPVFICDGDDRHMLHFAPLAEAGGAVLQRWGNGTDAPRFCSALPEQIREFAEKIVADMRVFWKRRKDISRQTGEVRAIVDKMVEGSDADVDAIIVDLFTQADDANLDFYVHFIGVDVAMRRGLVLHFIPASRRVRGDLLTPPFGVSGRNEDLAALRALGADGMITVLAASILSSGLVDRNAILAELAKSYECTFAIPSSKTPTYVTLYWHDGTIRAEVSAHDVMDWSQNTLDLMGVELSASQATVIVGRPISDIAELPFGGDVTIEEVGELIGGIRLYVDEGRLLIDMSTGRVWEAPEHLRN